MAFATVNYKRVIYSRHVFAPRPDVLNAFVDIAPVFSHANFERVNKRATLSLSSHSSRCIHVYVCVYIRDTQALNDRRGDLIAE